MEIHRTQARLPRTVHVRFHLTTTLGTLFWRFVLIPSLNMGSLPRRFPRPNTHSADSSPQPSPSLFPQRYPHQRLKHIGIFHTAAAAATPASTTAPRPQRINPSPRRLSTPDPPPHISAPPIIPATPPPPHHSRRRRPHHLHSDRLNSIQPQRRRIHRPPFSQGNDHHTHLSPESEFSAIGSSRWGGCGVETCRRGQGERM